MQLILLENVTNLGELGDVVTVKSGYGRNYLVPQGKAVAATKSNIEAFEKQRAELEARAAERMSAAQARCDAVDGQSITISANASGEGKLYGSVGPREVAKALTDAGFSVEKSEVVMGEGVIREVGEYDIDLHFYAEVDAVIKLNIEAEEPQA